MGLFDACTLGGIEARNHFVRSATFEGKATEDGYPTDSIQGLYAKLADGNVGVIITSYTYITDYEQPQKNQMGIYSDDLVPAYRRLTEAVHEHGGKIVMQIVHGSSWGQGYPETARILGPSAIEFPHSGLVPQEMTKADIASVVGLFGKAAARAKAAGFDGVQIHAAHSYLLAQFMSPLYNQRSDEYGGSTHNRFRIVRGVYAEVRKAVGDSFPVWVKINSSDEEEGGLTVEEFLQNACELAAAGIDAIEVSGERWPTHKASERAYYKDAAMRLADMVETPVILTGGLRSMDDIVPVYSSSKVQFFGFARPLMKNPSFVRELEERA